MDFGLLDALRDPAVVNDCWNGDEEFTSFLLKPGVLKLLVEKVISGPDNFSNLQEQYLQCHSATQVLTQCPPHVKRVILSDLDSLVHLCQCFMKDDISPLVVNFVHNIFISLFEFDEEKIHAFFTQSVNLVCFTLSIIDKPGCLPLLRRLIESNRSPSIGSLLARADLCTKILDRFTLHEPPAVHFGALRLLRGIVLSCRKVSLLSSEVSPSTDLLLDELESVEMIETVIGRMFPSMTTGSPSEIDFSTYDSLLIHGLSYLYFLICPTEKPYGEYHIPPLPRCHCDDLWDKPVGKNVCSVLPPYLSALKMRLCSAPSGNDSENPSLPRALTTARLCIIRFISHLLRARAIPILEEILRLDLLNCLVELFFQHPLNSLLHSTCEFLVRYVVLQCSTESASAPRSTCDSLNATFEATDALHEALLSSSGTTNQTSSSEMQLDLVSSSAHYEQEPTVFWRLLHGLIVDGGLLTKIMDSWSVAETNPRQRRLRGHLRLVSNVLCAAIGPPMEHPVTSADEPAELPSVKTEVHDLTSVAELGCFTEFEVFSKVASYIKADIPSETWDAWCQFVQGPLSEENKKCNSSLGPIRSATQTIPLQLNVDSDTKPTAGSLQNAYANFCSGPVTQNFVEQFGFAEDEFLEQQHHPITVLEARFSEVDFGCHLPDEGHNSTNFERACNELILLDGVEVGQNVECLPENDLIQLDSSASSTLPTSSGSPNPHDQSSSKPGRKMPTRDQILQVFDQVESRENESDCIEFHSGRCPDTYGFRKSTAIGNLHAIESKSSTWAKLPAALPPLMESEAEEKEAGEEPYNPFDSGSHSMRLGTSQTNPRPSRNLSPKSVKLQSTLEPYPHSSDPLRNGFHGSGAKLKANCRLFHDNLTESDDPVNLPDDPPKQTPATPQLNGHLPEEISLELSSTAVMHQTNSSNPAASDHAWRKVYEAVRGAGVVLPTKRPAKSTPTSQAFPLDSVSHLSGILPDDSFGFRNFSSGTIASIKVRHGSRQHKFPPFVISEDRLDSDDWVNIPDVSHDLGESTSDDSVDYLEEDPSVDSNSLKTKYRSHRTIQLKSACDGQLSDP